MPRGKRLRESDIRTIRQLLAHGRTNKDVANLTGFSISTIVRVKGGHDLKLADGSVMRYSRRPKARKAEHELVRPLPAEPIKHYERKSHFEDGQLVDGPKPAVIEVEVKEQVEAQATVTQVFDYLLNLDNQEFRAFVKNVRKARAVNNSRLAVLQRYEQQRQQALRQV